MHSPGRMGAPAPVAPAQRGAQTWQVDGSEGRARVPTEVRSVLRRSYRLRTVDLCDPLVTSASSPPPMCNQG